MQWEKDENKEKEAWLGTFLKTYSDVWVSIMKS